MTIRLPKSVQRSKKRVGRGMGSGKGSHTAGRGQKGQKTRASIGVLFEGMKTKKSLLKRLPLMRGKGKFHSKGNAVVIKYASLATFKEGSEISEKLLIEKGLVKGRAVKKYGIKVLGVGKNPRKFKFLVPVSKN